MTNATAATMAAVAQAAAPTAKSDIREPSQKNYAFEGLSTPTSYQPSSARSFAAAAAGETPPVGTVRQWLALDDYQGFFYRKNYTLRGVGQKIEVWVANDIAFPSGDCRNSTPGTTEVTDAQVAALVAQFDTNMYPKETAAFSTPPDRDGSNALVGPDANGNGGNYTGAGDKTVTLVDNVRDDNFYDFPTNSTYIAGFFSSQVNELLDRNVMTIDAFDWLHRTGANPPANVTADPCTSRSSRPRLYEGVFAHEWQHLLHYYADPFEGTWINEGLSDFAQTLVGYVDAKLPVSQVGADSHIFCYQGFGTVAGAGNANPRDCGGPENSLNLWGEGPPGAGVLADYGHAYSLMLFLYDRYGSAFMSALHRDGDRQGLASLDAQLKAKGVSDVYKVLHDFQSSTLLDKIIDTNLSIVLGVPRNRITTASLNSTVNLANPYAYATPGVAPNGADYVALRKANGQFLRGLDLRSLKFQAAKTLPSRPLEWTIVTNDPDRPGNPVLFSGNANNLDVSAVFSATVPASNPTLTFDAKYGAEEGYDFGYVEVSTDGGSTYTPIAGDKTVGGPLGPSLNGTTSGFEPHSFNLSAYAGKSVLISLRYVSDGGVNEGGLKVDNIVVGGTTISDGSSLTPFKSPSQIKPVAVKNINLKLVGIDPNLHLAWQFEYDHVYNLSLNLLELALLALFPQVVAIISYDEPTEQVQQYAPYTLTVNGVVQPGGSAS